MPAWLIWLIIAGVLAAGESASGTFVLLMIAGGAFGGAITAAVGAPLLAQVVVFIIITLLLLWLVRPIVVKRLLSDPPQITGSDALVGRAAVVLTPVSRDEGGRVRLNGGEWSARTTDAAQQLLPGTRVTVVAIEGATAIVWPDPVLPSV
jgi:membrane protein implicated in regulation of membrane protease activity